MRKITLFFAALLISMTAFAVNITDGTKLYLKPNANWNADGARFAAYFFGGDGELWVSMTDTDNDGVYEVTCSGTRGNVIFCRMNGGNSTNGWNNKWNQTADLTWDGTKNQYNVPDGAWDGSNNDYWVEVGNNTEVEVPTTWTIAGTIPCLGAEWATDKTENDLVEGENGVWTKTYTGVTLEAGTYEYKVTKNHMWGEAYPNDNAKLVIAADGKYDVTFTFDANAKTVNATAEKLCVKASWSFDGGITAAESGNLVLDKFTNVIVAFSGIDSVGREVTSVAGQGSSTNILFYEVLADGSLTPVEGNGLMYPKSSGKTVTYSLQAKNYKAVETGTYNYLKQGNYRIVLDGDAGVAGTGDILFKPNRSGLPRVYNEEVFTFDFKIENDYVARYAQSANFEATPAYDRFAAPTLLESLSEIIVKFTDYESITVNATYGDNQTYIPCVVSENGANVEKAQVKWEAVEGTPNALRLYIDEAVTAMGTYGITIPEGLVTFKKTAAEEAYNEAIALSYTVAQKNITEGLKLYYDFSAVEAWKTLPYAGAVLADGSTETIVDLVNISEGLWELTVPAGAYFHVTVNLGNSSTELVGSATTLFYDGTNNLYTLKADAPYVQWGMAELGDFTLSVYPTEPEVVATIVGGTKLYLKSDLGVSSSSAYGYNVVFGEFEVPSSGGSGGSVRPMQQAGSLGGTTTIPGTAMTKVYTKEGKYDIWEVVAPEGTADSIFNIVVSRKGTMISGYITPLKYDGEHNMFMLPENFAFDLRTPIADETAGEWGIYVEGEYSDPDPIVGTWNIEEGAVLESFESATITFTGVESAAAKSSYTNYFFYKVAEDGTETLVPSMCSDGYMDAAAEGASVTFSIDVEGCYLDMPQYGAYFALTSGDYRIKVPAGAIKFNGDATNLNTEAYVLNFTLNVPAAAEPVEAVYTVDPENNSTVAEIREIVLTFTEYETITVAEPDLMMGSNIPTVSMGYEGMFMPSGMFMMFAAGETANTLKLYVDPQYAGGMEAFTTEGEYKIVIPEGVVTFGEAGLNKTIELNYTVEAAKPEPVITEMETKNAYAYDVVVEANDELTKATVSYRLNAPAVAVKVQATVNGEVVREVEGTTVCRYADGVADNLNTVEVSLEGLGGNVVFQVAVEGTLVETPTEITKAYRFYHPQGVDVDVNPESEFFGRVYATENMPVASDGTTYISDINGNGVSQGLYVFDATLAPITNAEGKYGFTGGITFTEKLPNDVRAYEPRKVRLSEDGRLFITRQTAGVSPLVEVNPADLNANFTEVFTDFVYDATTYHLNNAEGAFIAAPNVGFDVKGSGEDLTIAMLSCNLSGFGYGTTGFHTDEYNLGEATTWSTVPTNRITALDGYSINYAGLSIEYDNEGGIWYCQYRGTPKDSEPALVHVNAQGVEDYKNTTLVARQSGIRLNADGTLLAVAGNGGKKCTVFEVGKDAEGKPTLTVKYEFDTNIGNNLNDIAWDYANNLYIVGNSGEWLKVFALPRESAVVTTPAAARYTVELPLPMEVEFANIAAIYEKGMWDMAYYESYDNNNVKAILKSQPTVVEKVVSAGYMGSINNYYLNDGTGVILLQAEGDIVNPITDENWEVIGWDTIPGLNLEVGKKLPADFTATIDFKCVVDDETYLPTGEVYGAPVLTFMPKVLSVEVDAEGWETLITEPNDEFIARCEDSDFVEDTVTVTVEELLANRINYAGKVVSVNAEANYYAEQMMDYFSGTTVTTAYMYWDAEESFDVEVYDGVTYVSPKYTEDWNNYAGKVFNVQAENLPEAAFDANATISVAVARFDWNSIAVGQTFLAKEYEVKTAGEGPEVDVENSELVVNVYSNNGSVYVETEAGVMIEVYTVNGLRVYAGVSTTNTTVINGLNTNIAIIRVNGVAYKVFVK